MKVQKVWKKRMISAAAVFALCLPAMECKAGQIMNWGGSLEEKEQEAGKGKEGGQTEPEAKWWAGDERAAGGDETESRPEGDNLSGYGHCMLEIEGNVYAVGRRLPVAARVHVEDKEWHEGFVGVEACNIYIVKDDRWEIFAPCQAEPVNDEWDGNDTGNEKPFAGSLAYCDGFLYYTLLYGEPQETGWDGPGYLYRIPIQGGEAEKLAACHGGFSICNGKIYSVTLEKGPNGGRECVYWEMGLDGEDRHAIYRKAGDTDSRAFALGGEGLYMGDGNGVTRLSMDNGDIRHYTLDVDSGMGIGGLYYEGGFLYATVGVNHGGWLKKVVRIDVVSGKKEYLASNAGAVWVENGCLYYLWYGSRQSVNSGWKLVIYDLETKQMLETGVFGSGVSYMERLGDGLVIDIGWGVNKDEQIPPPEQNGEREYYSVRGRYAYGEG